ncbi:AbrB family transcriptional regulator [Nostocales cyanobacterium HT-58-2]|nr:AbrB family transcriptional regulator [Nostocales cyanobacterium HT-58-2]
MTIWKSQNCPVAIIPKSLREAHRWEVGQELIAIDMGDGILLKPKKPFPETTFPETTLDDVAGCLNYQGKPQSLEDIDNAIRQGIEELWYGRS